MAVRVNVPEAAWASQEVTLNGVTYGFTFKYNNTDSRWRLTLSQSGTEIISSIKVMENQALTSRYTRDEFNHGELFCFRFKDDGLPVGRDNFGIGKAYELLYLSNIDLGEDL